jgi:aspartate kinase
MSGVTDALLALARDAASGRGSPVERLKRLRARHDEAARALAGPSAELVMAGVAREIDAIGEALARISAAGAVEPALQDAVAAGGELLTSRLVVAALTARGLPARWIDARDVVRTDASYTCAIPDINAIEAAARVNVLPALDAGEIPVIGGFVGAAPDGSTTTLGRGGSDYSASLLGAAVHAAEIQIWTDVDGMLSADPRIVESPRLVSRLSFAEASELAYFGAKVLHPSTILPAIGRDIPVRILNSRRPEVPGTLITGGAGDSDRAVTALACKRDITVVDITSTRMLMAYGFLRRVFETFERHRTPVDVVCTSEVSVSVTVDDSRHIDAIASDLREFADVSVERDMAILCAVGENLRVRPDAMSEVMGKLARFPLRMVSQAASRRNLTVVLHDAAAIAAMRYLHDEMFTLAQAS